MSESEYQISIGHPENETISCFNGFNDQSREFIVTGIEGVRDETISGKVFSEPDEKIIHLGYVGFRQYESDQATYDAIQDDEEVKSIIVESLDDLIGITKTLQNRRRHSKALSKELSDELTKVMGGNK